MNIGIVQSSPSFGEVRANIAACLDLMSAHTADVWVLPELFATGYQFRSAAEARELSEPVPSGKTTRTLTEFAAERDCFIVAGLPERERYAVYNASVLVGPKGFLACYRKVHLFYEEKIYFSPGNRPFFVTDIGIAKLGMMICFDHLFPESARSLALQGADIICHPANLVLPDLAQRTMTIRALENGVFTATANRIGTEERKAESLTYTGQSQVIDPHGAPLIRLSADRVEAAAIAIDPAEARSKGITSHNDKLIDRRVEMYHL